ncbi:ankyrin-3-like isoform X2 [Macrobrachium nipponense]|uniref:ankyrin-3-like isoform X2 n=1 Tax=Macrobrachium nipponense TaxID=159736 RepID=UPI0030C7D06B
MSSTMERMMIAMVMIYALWASYEITSVKSFGIHVDCDALQNKEEKEKLECHAQQFIKFARKGKIDDVEKKLEKFINKNFLLSYTEKLGIHKGFTGLLWAARNNDTAMVNLLVEQGSVVYHSTGSGYTPLYYMAEYGNTETVNMLLRNGAKVNTALLNGYTPVLIAAERGYTAIVQSLLENNANPNVKSKKGATPILVAAQNGNTEIVRLLLERGADPNAKSEVRGRPRTHYRFFPLYFAAKWGHLDMVNLLLEAKADVTYRTLYGETALITATAWNRGPTVARLLDASADPNVADKLKTGALHRAAYYGYTDILQILIEKGAVVDAQNFEGRTPLHFCAKGAKTLTLKELLKSCPDDGIRDIRGKTALDLAVSEKERLMMKTKKTRRTHTMILGFETFIPMLKGYTNKACS